MFVKNEGSYDAVKACAGDYRFLIVILSDKSLRLEGFPNIIVDRGAVQRYAGVDQTNIPYRTAKEHYVKEHFPTDTIIVFLHQSDKKFPGATFDCWMQGYDSLQCFFDWMQELMS